MTPKKTDIVLVTWGRQKMTELVINAIRRNTRQGTYRLIVVDNGSDEVVQDMLVGMATNFKINHLIINATNEGLEPARNKGLERVESDRFVCVDNDCLPEPADLAGDWLSKLNYLMDAQPEYAAVACRTQVMIGTGNIFDGREDEPIVDFPHPGGSLRLMNTDATRAVGGWRDEVQGRGAEERYICGKLRDAGYKTGFASQVTTLHLFGVREHGTDRWGYDGSWKPEDTGHSDIWHPALEQGDSYEDVKRYVGSYYADRYFGMD